MWVKELWLPGSSSRASCATHRQRCCTRACPENLGEGALTSPVDLFSKGPETLRLGAGPYHSPILWLMGCVAPQSSLEPQAHLCLRTYGGGDLKEKYPVFMYARDCLGEVLLAFLAKTSCDHCPEV